MKVYKATITPTVSGGNIEISISANSAIQAQELIKTLPFFKSFVRQPVMMNELDNNNLTKLSKLMAQAQAKDQAELGAME